jgi:hypothetical protein
MLGISDDDDHHHRHQKNEAKKSKRERTNINKFQMLCQLLRLCSNAASNDIDNILLNNASKGCGETSHKLF